MISGHADASGDEQRNLLLSQQRARAVGDWLQRMGGFAEGCLVVQGYGSGQPLQGNVAMAGAGVNRRVDIRLMAVEGGCAASL
jgi:type VI secretion system protein VasL